MRSGDGLRVGRITTRAEDADQGTPIQSKISPSILVYEGCMGLRAGRRHEPPLPLLGSDSEQRGHNRNSFGHFYLKARIWP